MMTLLTEEWKEIQGIYLYGSMASGQARGESDADLAVLSSFRLSDPRRFMLAQKIAARIKREVDLVELSRANTVLQFQVVSQGKRIYCGDEKACERFEDYTYRFYAKLNEERQGILNDIKKRGSVF